MAVGLVGMFSVPVGAAAVLLLTLAAGLLCMEVLAYPGIGLHALGGGVSLGLAGLFWTGEWSGAHPAVVLPVAVITAVVTYLAGRRSWRSIRNRPLEHSTQLTGRRTVVLSSMGPVGQGVIAGELWELRARRGTLQRGQAVQVVEAHAACLIVEPVVNVDFS